MASRRGRETTQGKIAYRGPNSHPGLPKIKLDLTADEVLVRKPELRAIDHRYTDSPLSVGGVLSYSITELFGEKLRALSERCRPRDLYGVVHLYRHPDLIGKSSLVAGVLLQKCLHAGIAIPTVESIGALKHDELQEDWAAMLGHQLPEPLAPFSQFWNELEKVFNWLDGKGPVLPLPRAQFSDLDYRPESGRSGPRSVEPYSLRKTRKGKVVLMVVNDLGMLRSYRIDRIARIRPTSTPFIPRYQIEFY